MKIFKILCTLVVSAFVLGGCGGGGGSPGGQTGKTFTTTAPSPVTLLPGTSAEYNISGGVPPYRVGNSDTQIAVGAIDGDKLLVGAVNGGAATINVYDYSGAAIQVAVTVGSSIPLTTTAPSSLTLGVGSASTRTYTIRGGIPPYVVESSDINVVAAAKMGADKFSVTGVAIGAGVVSVTDAVNTKLDIAVTVGAPELRVSPDDLTLFPGIPAIVKISGGQPPYHVAGGIPDAIKTTIVGDELRIEPQLASEVEIAVADATGQTQKIKIKVEIGSAQFGISPGALTVTEEDDQPITLRIFGAAPGEVCIFTDKTLLKPTSSGCTTERVITLDTGTAGSRCVESDTDVMVTAVDKNGAVGVSVITIRDLGKTTGACSKAFAVTPTTLTVAIGKTSQAVITGGSGNYVINYSSGNFAEATISGELITVEGVATGTETITIRDQKDPSRSATITVTVP